MLCGSDVEDMEHQKISNEYASTQTSKKKSDKLSQTKT